MKSEFVSEFTGSPHRIWAISYEPYFFFKFRTQSTHIKETFAFQNAQVKLVGESGQDQGSKIRINPGKGLSELIS